MKIRLIFSLLCLLIPVSTALADYLWPLPFGNELTSIFGDYRTRRYHVGIDVRTGGEIGKAVVAPMDGHIMRLRTGYYGYGKAVYFKMNDGNVAVFGHLSAFAPEVEEYIRGRQIEKEDYNLEIDLDASRFPFKRGETVAFSGATGVGAPHLHFEVRTPDNVPMNPLQFDGLKLDDNVAPTFKSLQLVGFDNDDLARALGWDVKHPLIKKRHASEYSVAVSLPCGLANYWLSTEIVDKLGKSSWDKPIYDLEVRSGDSVIYRLKYDEVPFDETYLISAQRNYQLATRGAQEYYNLVSVDASRRHRNFCELLPSIDQPVEIIARDIAGNSSRAIITFYDAQSRNRPGNAFVPRPDTARLSDVLDRYSISKNRRISAAMIPARSRMYVLARVVAPANSILEVKSLGSSTDAVAAMHKVAGNYYLATIDSLQSNGELLSGDSIAIQVTPATGESFHETFPVRFYRAFSLATSSRTLYSSDQRFSVNFPPLNETIFPLDQSLYFNISQTGAGRFPSYEVFPNDLALMKQITYSYQLGDIIPKGIALYAGSGNNLYYLGGELDSTTRTLSVKSYVLGTITAAQDTTPPNVQHLRPINGATLTQARPVVSFSFSDGLSGVSDNIDVLIDGRWCIPVYDPETGVVTASPHFDLDSGKHKLEIRVLDKSGNSRKISTSFSRSAAKAR